MTCGGTAAHLLRMKPTKDSDNDHQLKWWRAPGVICFLAAGRPPAAIKIGVTTRAILLLLCLASALAEQKSVRVFVALCDNKTQGIAPVGEKIGNGDNPDANLYWGCTDGLGSYFRQSKRWKVADSKADVSKSILRRLHLRHVEGDVDLTADAYRGSNIRECLEDFEKAANSGDYDLVAFIGHNVLMDVAVPETKAAGKNSTRAVVLCCVSDRYFRPRLERMGCKPLLLTQQLMYPGSFILHDVIEEWRRGGSNAGIRQAAGRAYAKNQKISVSAATNVFAKPALSAAGAGPTVTPPASKPK